MKDAFMIKFTFSSILFCPNISAGFEETRIDNGTICTEFFTDI